MIDIRCADIDATLATGEPLSPAQSRHVESCASCSRVQAAMGPISGLSRLANVSAPTGLRERVFEAVEQSAQSSPSSASWASRRKFLWGGATVAAAGTGALLWWRQTPVRRAEDLLDLMMADHLKYRDRADAAQIVSSDAEVVEQWVREQLQTAARVFELRGVRLVGARHCRLGRTQAGLVFYRVTSESLREHVASLYVFSAPDADFSHMTPLPSVAGKHVCRRHQLGLSAAIWEERGLTYAFVSELDDPDLSHLLQSV